MGVQTFSDERLRFLHRRHKSDQILPAVKALRKAGIKNISVDLIFGFPDQTLDEWRDDLQKALALDVEHISAYSLMYEEGTPLTRMLDEGKIKALDEETCPEMYYTLIDTMTAAGYEHYEISNFCKPGFRSRHNSDYWKPWSEHYLGLGAGAHSYDGNTRSWNVCDVEKYILGNEPKECEVLDDDMRYNDLITTALRTREGIDLNIVKDYLGEEYSSYLAQSAKKEIENGRLAIEGSRIFLTRQGLYVSNDVMSELIKA
jgi:oxygen-independent coproporphyrinogen-3 oxidase